MIYTWDINPVALSFAGIELHWYGLAYLASYFIFEYFGWWLYQKYHPKKKLSRTAFGNLVFAGFVAGVIGGRLGYFAFYQPQIFWTNPVEVLQIWNGGMSIHGGILGVALFGWWYCRKHQLNWASLADIFSLPLAGSLVLGRLANFVNGELYGRPTDQSWGVIFPHVDELARHPSQLYEMGKNVIIFIAIVWAFQRGWIKTPGKIFGLFCCLYGIQRFLIEFVREPNFFIGPLTMGQVLCMLMVFLGGFLLYRK